MPRTRTFIAIELGKAVRDRLIGLQESLTASAAGVKWVEPENLHVTLLFLGEVDDRELPGVCRAVQEALSEHAEFTLSVEGVGCFPNPRGCAWCGSASARDCRKSLPSTMCWSGRCWRWAATAASSAGTRPTSRWAGGAARGRPMHSRRHWRNARDGKPAKWLCVRSM